MAQTNVDLQSIDSLDRGLGSALSAIASLRGEVRAYMDNAVMQGRQVVDRLRRIEEQCQRVYDSASAAYNSCLSRRRYDSEKDRYTPSCDCEERDLNSAARALEKARAECQVAEGCLKDIERERDSYMEARHADYNMGVLIDDKIPEAARRLAMLREYVENHNSMYTDLTSSSLGRPNDGSRSISSDNDSPTTANMFRNDTPHSNEHSPVSQFREGMRRIKEKQEEQQRLAFLRWTTGGDQNERSR